MRARFAHSEPLRNENVRWQRDDTAQPDTQCANMESAKKFGANLKAAREAKGWSQGDLVSEAGVASKSYISELERGLRPIPPGTMLEKLATALDVDAAQLVAADPAGEPGQPRYVRLVGYVGAGSEAHYYADADDPGEFVEAPEGATQHTVAAGVRGTSLGPALDGWLVFYDDIRSPVTPDLHGQLCVVWTDDQVLVKVIRPAGEPNRFHLISNGGDEPIFDRLVHWAAKVKSMKPRG